MSRSRSKNAVPPVESRTELERRLMAGDTDGALETLERMTASERSTQRSGLRRLMEAADDARWTSASPVLEVWPEAGTSEVATALASALFVVGEPADMSDLRLGGDELVSLARRFGTRILDEGVDAMLEANPWRIAVVQRLIGEGLIARPTSDAYALGLIALSRTFDGGRKTILEFVDEDPGLLEADAEGRIPLLRVFDVEGTPEHSLASQDKYSVSRPWTSTLLTLIEQGRLPRDVVIGKTLDSLEADYAEFRAGWFARFHEALALTVDELAFWTDRYLGLLQSRVPTTRKLALDAVARLYKASAIDESALLASLEPIFASEAKAHVEAGLKLLGTIVRRSPSRAHEASALAGGAIAHASPDVQRKALSSIASFGASDATREHLRRHASQIAASLRPTLDSLLGSDAPRALERPADEPRSAPRGPLSPLDPSRRVVPIDDTVDLVEQMAHLVQHPDDADAFERILDALVRLAPLDVDTSARIAKIGRPRRAYESPLAVQALRLAELVADPAADVPADDADALPATRRTFALARIAAHGTGLGSLASPTHRRGFIDARVLAERVTRYEATGIVASREEQALALARLSPTADADTLATARALADTPFSRTLRYALGDDVVVDAAEPLFLVAARIRHVDRDDPEVALAFGSRDPGAAFPARYRWRVHTRSSDGYVFHSLRMESAHGVPAVAPDEIDWVHPPMKPPSWAEPLGGVGIVGNAPEFFASILPSSLETYFAEGVRRIANNLDWFEARWENRAFLTKLLDPTVPMTEYARLLLAFGLAAKEPGEATTAVDALVAGVREGRLCRDEFGTTMRSVLETPLVKAARWTKRLAEAANADSLVARFVADVIVRMLVAPLDPVPKDTSGLVELLVELHAAHALALDDASLAAMAAMRLPPRGKRALDSLRK